ncbi:TRAP transporter small permease [Roseococcus sp. SYP-B2431]|uniref:TRAP transporter small permease n=1 Tax=Roseococcus sp. SYP-B2431 TaxID=2496640 RepID=UPI0010394C4D|nr:TRAP transporter small permease [Roseococcus sp. SYP-B2431]TCH97673.1 TRAP transporter small permease [Roseococcus sp. SYP-B2431]
MATDFDPTAAPADPRTRLPLTLERVLLAVAMGAMALITAGNVVTRYLTDISFSFTEEYSVALMVGAAMVGTALATAAGRHIRIGYFVDKLPPRRRRIADIVASALLILCFALIAWYGARMVWDEYDFEVLSPGLGHPQWLYSVWLPVLALLVIGRAAGRILRLWRGEDS